MTLPGNGGIGGYGGRFGGRYGGGYGGFPQDGTKETDAFGHKWTYDAKRYMWCDEFGSVTANGVADLGSSSNPLMDKDGQAW